MQHSVNNVIATLSCRQSSALNMTDGADILFILAALRIIRSASSTWPRCNSHRGDSGITLCNPPTPENRVAISGKLEGSQLWDFKLAFVSQVYHSNRHDGPFTTRWTIYPHKLHKTETSIKQHQKILASHVQHFNAFSIWFLKTFQ